MPRFRHVPLAAWLLLVSLSSLARAGDPFWLSWWQRDKPPTCRGCRIEDLASQIDWLESHIDTYGTIVPKQPDVWGEARLTRHRHEVEKQLAEDMNKFRETLNASVRRSDQSFLGVALTLSGSLSGNSTEAASAASTLSNVTTIFGNLTGTGADTAISRNATPSFGTFGASIGNATLGNVSIEPTLYLQQKVRYLNLLTELRRLNEGDDTSDSPGYALNVVRIPISILPGKKTRAGYGAEIQITATPHVTPALLPSTFRNLVINDVVDELALPGRKLLDDKQCLQELRSLLQDTQTVANIPKDCFGVSPAAWGDDSPRSAIHKAAEATAEESRQKTYRWQQQQQQTDELRQKYNAAQKQRQGQGLEPDEKLDSGLNESRQNYNAALDALKQAEDEAIHAQGLASTAQNAERTVGRLGTKLRESTLAPFAAPIVADRGSNARLPIPPTQIADVYGVIPLAVLAVAGDEGMRTHPVHASCPHLGDVQAFLKMELQGAYDFLSQPDAFFLWQNYCTPELVAAIRERRDDIEDPLYSRYKDQLKQVDNGRRPVFAIRDAFFHDIACHYPRAAFTPTTSLAWAVIVNSALLNAQLVDDMRKVAKQKGDPGLECVPEWPLLFLPEPPPEAIELFNAYVLCRWPVHVFALDPATEEQNVGDVYSMRREMQLAAAVALAKGEISGAAAMRFMRRTEMDIETIALNRTAVAFAHGDDTFGWRFYPRVQTPPSVGTLKAFQQTVCGGPTTDALLNQRQLEPGLREATAIVLMPSFVPDLTFDCRGNWFKLTDPRHKELTLHDAMKISRTWQSVRDAAPPMCRSCCYRAEDLAWLTKAVTQIERKLPLQTMLVAIPYENTLGGFKLFNSGITDLAPSLTGWYGAPGITVDDVALVACGCTTATPQADAGGNKADQKKETPTGGIPYGGIDSYANPSCAATCMGTTLFLVGDNFSVQDTLVLAGGRAVPFLLLSRQIMQVTIPPNVMHLPEKYDNGTQQREVVDVHVATPYGVSNHLLVPVPPKATPQPKPAAVQTGFFWKDTDLQASLTPIPGVRIAPPFFKLTFTFAHEPLKSLVIFNKTENPAPHGLKLVAVIRTKATGTPLGQTIPLDLSVDHGNAEVAVDAGRLIAEVEGVVADQLLLKDATDLKELNITGYLCLGDWPPVATANTIVVQVTQVCTGTAPAVPSGSNSPTGAEFLPPVPPRSGSSGAPCPADALSTLRLLLNSPESLPAPLPTSMQ